MECAIAIQVLPMDAADDDEVCRIVDEVIAYLTTLDVKMFVSPFETTIEGDYATCIEALAKCQLIAAQAGAEKIMTYAKIDYRPNGDLLTTNKKVGKYADLNSSSGLGEGCSAPDETSMAA